MFAATKKKKKQKKRNSTNQFKSRNKYNARVARR